MYGRAKSRTSLYKLTDRQKKWLIGPRAFALPKINLTAKRNNLKTIGGCPPWNTTYEMPCLVSHFWIHFSSPFLHYLIEILQQLYLFSPVSKISHLKPHPAGVIVDLVDDIGHLYVCRIMATSPHHCLEIQGVTWWKWKLRIFWKFSVSGIFLEELWNR